MPEERPKAYPYIPNSAPEVRAEMLKSIGVHDVDELYAEIPNHLRLNRRLNVPEALASEYDLRRHVEDILGKNKTCGEYTSFLGAGCYQHFIPAVCDEINSRGEFVTAYAGGAYSDHGKHQAWFEFQSLIGELVDLDVVSFPTYDGVTAATSALLMACRLTNRYEILLPKNLSPEKLAQARNFCKAVAEIKEIGYDPKNGLMDIEDLRSKLTDKTAAVYFENPSYLGVLETKGKQIADLAHAKGALAVVGIDPLSLGILTPPGRYGADIVVGDAQTLGNHQWAGGGQCGFIASRQDPRYLEEYPTMLESIIKTKQEGEMGFGSATMERTSYDRRDKSKDFTGTTTGLWAITAAVYMSLLGPQGIKEVDETIVQKTQYALQRLNTVKGVRANPFSAVPFQEFVVNFDETGKSVKEINKALLEKRIFGGKDISTEFPELGQSALYAFSEVSSKDGIDKLVEALEEVVR
jgi:glycine dehydrogenase subunit 1